MVMVSTPIQPTTTGNGARLVATDGRELPLTSVRVSAEAGGGIARVTLTQRFANPYAEPLEVRYLLPLPSDGAVSGFSFTLDGERVVGEVTGKQAARERFTQAIAEGRTAALLEQERSSLFTQRVGNIPPRGEVLAEVVVDQPLRWLEEGAWEWRFPTVVGPRYLGSGTPDAARITVPVGDAPLGVRCALALAVLDRPTGPIESPSHALTTHGAEVALEGARLDRDLVVRWPVALPDVSATVLAARPVAAAHEGHGFALLTVAPPTGGWTAIARDLTFIIDTSGSMSGFPLEQAKKVVLAMIDTLGVEDRLELIEFGNAPRRWKAAPEPATETTKRAAAAWVTKLSASGGTEMHRAVLEALRPLRKGSQRQVVVLTDGLIGFEREIIDTLMTKLPEGVRLHAVGVGSAVNRSLTQALARAGRGTELIIGLGEDAERLVGRLVARTTAPLVTDLRVEGEGLLAVTPACLPDLYAEAPALITVRVDARTAERGGEVVVSGRTAEGSFVQALRLPALERGQGPSAVAALHAREQVEDLEMALSAGADRATSDAAIERVGVSFQIATRLTSWVAVSKAITVDAPGRITVEQPHELPHGMSAEGLGLRPASVPAGMERFADLKVLAEGGMGIIYQAVDQVTGKRVAIKALGPMPLGEEQEEAALPPPVTASKKTRMLQEDRPAEPLEWRDELILEDSTSSTISIDDLMGGERTAREPASSEANLTRAGSAPSPQALEALRERAAAMNWSRPFGGKADEGAEGALRAHAARRPRRRTIALLLLIVALLTLLALWRAGVIFSHTSAPQDQGVGPR